MIVSSRLSFVVTKTFSGPTKALARSSVFSKRVLPSRTISGFGLLILTRGHRRLPLPPAITTAYAIGDFLLTPFLVQLCTAAIDIKPRRSRVYPYSPFILCKCLCEGVEKALPQVRGLQFSFIPGQEIRLRPPLLLIIVLQPDLPVLVGKVQKGRQYRIGPGI